MAPLGLESFMPFGKHRGEQVEDLIDDDPYYLAWCVDSDVIPFDEEVIRKLEVKKII